MQLNNQKRKNGFTLLELMVATFMLTLITGSSMLLLRTSYTSWSVHQEDHQKRRSGLAVLNHIVRHVRQAQAVVAISESSNPSGLLSLMDVDGNTMVWEHDPQTNQVLFGFSSATEVLAHDIVELSFVGFKANGTDTTTEPGLVRSLGCETKVGIERPAGVELVTMSSRAWLRAW